MLRIVEALFIVVMVLGSLLTVINLAVIPSPHAISTVGLEDLAESTLRSLDQDKYLTETVFSYDEESWLNLQSAIDSSLPVNIVYNLTAYRVDVYSHNTTYTQLSSISNFQGDFPSSSAAVSWTVTSPNVTTKTVPETIRKGKELTLYILNCEDANGWWITGYTGQTLAQDIYEILSPYFITTVLVNSTSMLETLLNGEKITSLEGEKVEEAVIINTFGEAVPIPQSLSGSPNQYPWYIGQKTNTYNWTWVSIVGYPLYYVSNKDVFSSSQNNFGIYGMRYVGPTGLNGFLRGLDGSPFVGYSQWITGDIGVVDLTATAREFTNYYGIYPETYQTSTRALPAEQIFEDYNVMINSDANIFEPVEDGGENYYAGATYSHWEDNEIHGSFTAIGLARTPDIRISVLGLLSFFQPVLIRSELGVSGTNRVIVLQIGQVGGD